MYNKIWGLGFLIWILVLGGAFAAPPVSDYAYFAKTDEAQDYIVRIDLENGKAEKCFKIKSCSYFSLDKEGIIYLSTTGGFDYLSQDVEIWNPFNKKKLGVFKTRSKSTLKNIAVNNKLFVVNEFADRKDLGDSSAIEVYDLKTRKYLKTIYFPYPHQRMESQICLSPNKKKIYAVTWKGGSSSRDGEGRIYCIDIEKSEIEQSFGPYDFAYALSIAADKNGRIYVSSNYKKVGDMPQSPEDAPKKYNNDLLVFSTESGKLLKKINISGYTNRIAYLAKADKLYIASYPPESPVIDIIDCTKQKRVKTILNTWTRDLAYVGNGKVLAAYKDMKTGEDFLGIIDTNKDEIIIKTKIYAKAIGFNPYVE